MSQFVCAECGYPSLRAEGHCDNPACLANPHLSEAHKQKLRDNFAAYEARKREDEERFARKARLRAQGFTTPL